TYPNCFCSNNEIRIINCENLYIDTDLSDSEYYGVNIVLVSPHQILVENKTELNIITNGKDADDDWKDRPAKSGHGTDRKGNGNKGEDGYDGKPGKSAGQIYIVANKLPCINISAVGGKGGQGQNGGNGAKGLDGKDGEDADKEALLEKAQHRDILYSEWAVRVRRKGIDGKRGSSGGDAGDSGVDWLASSLNHVSEKMAELEGLPADKIKTQPDIEHDLQQILILKEEFSQTVHAEKQRLQAEKLDTNELSLKHHQSIYQQLQDEIQRVDVNHLATGLDIRSTEIVNLRNTISRIVNEQRFSQRLAAVQRKLEALIEIPQEELLKIMLNRNNIEIITENLNKQERKVFEIGHNLVKVENFNTNLNEKSLLEVGNEFLKKLVEIISAGEVEELDLIEISYFIRIYLYNLQQANSNLKDLKTNKDQQSQLYEIFLEYPSLRGSILLDSLICFAKTLQTEWLRHYLIIWIMKTLSCIQEFSYESEKNLRNLLQTIPKADHNQLEQIDYVQQSSHILEGFPCYDFDKTLY
ncbi:unnamed protein product, partial [Rotaria magnacalcarata]